MKTYSLSARLIAVCLLALVMFLTGCGGGGGPGSYLCTADVEPGIVVTVVDAQTRAPIAQGATGTILKDKYSDTMRPFESDANGTLLSLAGAYETPGVFTVRIEKTGYQAWEQTNVRVTNGPCHVKGVQLEADLQPAK